MYEELHSNCPYCGEPNLFEADLEAGSRQRYVQDCHVCCRPIDVTVTADANGRIRIQCRTQDDTC